MSCVNDPLQGLAPLLLGPLAERLAYGARDHWSGQGVDVPPRESADREPRYRQIAAALRAEIVAGAHGVGEPLPSERVLAERFEVSRPTVRDAVDELRAEGLVVARQGRGLFIRPDRPMLTVHRRAGAPADVATALEDLETHTTSRTYREPASAATAAALGLEVGDDVLVHHHRVAAADRPLHLATSRASPDNLAPGDSASEPPGSRAGDIDPAQPVEGVQERVRSRMPTADEVVELELASGTPVVELVRVVQRAGRRELLTQVLAGDAFELVFDLLPGHR